MIAMLKYLLQINKWIDGKLNISKQYFNTYNEALEASKSLTGHIKIYEDGKVILSERRN